MSFYYFDADAFIKLLLPEVGNKICNEIYNNPENHILTSNYTIVEVYSALTVCRNGREITEKVFSDAISRFNAIIIGSGSGFATITIIELSADHLNKAKNLVIGTRSIRPGDSSHVSVALDYKDLDVIMVSGDGRVLKTSRDHGLSVINVNNCICPKCGTRFTFERRVETCEHCGMAQEHVTEAICSDCGNACNECSSTKWCNRIRKAIAV